jgi:hypothetical protein
MCIFCGGTCGGVGDMLLPSLATVGSLVVMRVRVARACRNTRSEEASPEEKDEDPTRHETQGDPTG